MSRPYDHIATEWHTHRDRGHAERVLRYVDQVLTDVTAGSKILDLGCGTGHPIATHITRRGYTLIGVDESKAMLTIAQTTIPAVHLIQADIVEVQFAGSFAAAVAWDSLFHIQRRHHATILSKLYNTLDVGGKLLLSVGGSGSSGFTSEMYGHEFFYSAHDPEVTRRLLESAGFEIELWEADDPTSHGHVAVIARKVSLSK